MKRMTALLLISWMISGCSNDPSKTIIVVKRGDTGDGDTGDGDADADGDADSDGDGDADTEVYDSDPYTSLDSDEACGEWEIALDIYASRLMILQDVSYSMAQGSPTKWEQAREAMERILKTFSESRLIEFGLDAFPRNGYCGTSGPVVLDCAPDQDELIKDTLNNLDLEDGTPLYRAIQNFTDPEYAPRFSDPDVDSYLVVLTDGRDVCGTDPDQTDVHGATSDDLSLVTEELLVDQGIKTIAVGFGDEVDADQLDAIARAGEAFDDYFIAADRDDLQQAFIDIVALTIRCSFDIDPEQVGDEEMDRDKVNFYFDAEILPMDDDCRLGKGWTWKNAERTEVEFCEEACNALKYGEVIDISGEFGCETKIMVK